MHTPQLILKFAILEKNMKTVFLDRDGVINENPPDRGYVCNWSDFYFISNSLKAIQLLTQTDYRIFIVTNQAGIGKGIFTEQQLAEIHKRMLNEINEADGRIERIYYCPHQPNAGCNCRKPKNGMLLKAANDYAFDLLSTYLIGDSISDMQAAENASVMPMLVLTGHGQDSYKYYTNSDASMDEKPNKIFTNLYTATRWLLNSN